MEASSPTEEYKDMYAEEMVKHLLYKIFGIYWEPQLQSANSPKLGLKEFHTSVVLLGEAVTAGWKKYYAAIEHESKRIFKSLDSCVDSEQIYASLKDVAKNIKLPSEFIFFIVMATFGELCVQITKSGLESSISNAVSGAKRYIVVEGYACTKDLQMNSVQFLEYCEDGEIS